MLVITEQKQQLRLIKGEQMGKCEQCRLQCRLLSGKVRFFCSNVLNAIKIAL